MRITQKDLETVARRINLITGSPVNPYEADDTGRLRAQIGNYHISYAYGGASLSRMVTDGGGTSDVLSCGHITKRELYDRMQAYIAGIESKEV